MTLSAAYPGIKHLESWSVSQTLASAGLASAALGPILTILYTFNLLVSLK